MSLMDLNVFAANQKISPLNIYIYIYIYILIGIHNLKCFAMCPFQFCVECFSLKHPFYSKVIEMAFYKRKTCLSFVKC